MTIVLTELAELKLRLLLRSNTTEDAPARGFRLGVKSGGCSGYEYALNITRHPKEEDILQEVNGLPIYLDAPSLPLLQGVVMDYVEGITQSGFKFTNPNATDSCGCGKSFQAHDCAPGSSCS